MTLSISDQTKVTNSHPGESEVTYLGPSVRIWPQVTPSLTLLPSLGILQPPAGCDSLPEDLEVSLCGDTSGTCLTSHVTGGVTYIRDLTPCTAYTILIRERWGAEVWRGRGETPGLSQVTGKV